MLVASNNWYFDYVTENHVQRVLFNNGINDEDLYYWVTSREAYFTPNPKYPMPQDLEAEITSLG